MGDTLSGKPSFVAPAGRRPLEGKVAMVTGGSRGIGAAIVRRLALDGAAVAFTYSSAESKAAEVSRNIEEAGGRSLALRADSGSAAELQEVVQRGAKAFGGLDIFVNNAGILRTAPLDRFPLEALEQLIAVNIRAAFIGIQAAARQLRDGGRIIAIGSSAADYIGMPGISAYSMTKAAIQGLVRGGGGGTGPPCDHREQRPAWSNCHGHQPVRGAGSGAVAEHDRARALRNGRRGCFARGLSRVGGVFVHDGCQPVSGWWLWSLSQTLLAWLV